MADDTLKPATPAYTTFGSLINFLNGFREEGHVPMQVDKSHMRTLSGSTQSSHLQSMKFLKLIDNDGKPLERFEKYVLASDEDRKAILREILQESYPYLFGNGFDLARASGKMVEDKFRDQQIQGATVVKCMAFFLAAAKAADIKISTAVKAPPRPAAKRPRRDVAWQMPTPAAAAPMPPPADDDEDDDQASGDKPASLKFEIPIPIDRKVKIIVPSPWSERDWDRFKAMLDIYIEGWKEAQKDKGPTPE